VKERSYWYITEMRVIKTSAAKKSTIDEPTCAEPE
jgi:hypothetical protein